MTITGKIEADSNFITVYTENALYCIARATGEWDYREVGDYLANGWRLTAEILKELAAGCTHSGTVTLT